MTHLYIYIYIYIDFPIKTSIYGELSMAKSNFCTQFSYHETRQYGLGSAEQSVAESLFNCLTESNTPIEGHEFLVGGFNQFEKYESADVSWDDELPNMFKNKTVPNHQADFLLFSVLIVILCSHCHYLQIFATPPWPPINHFLKQQPRTILPQNKTQS